MVLVGRGCPLKAEQLTFFFWAQAASGIPSKEWCGVNLEAREWPCPEQERARVCGVSWQEKKARVLSVCLSVGAARLGQSGKATWNNLGEKG